MPYKDRQGRTCGFLDVDAGGAPGVGAGRVLRRYFILNRHLNRLHYYMDNPQNLPPRSPPVGSIDLSYVSMVNDATSSRPKLRFGFFVEVAGERHYLCANDQDDMTGWVNALREATKVRVARSLLPQERTDDVTDGISYRAEVCGGVVVRTPLESTASVSRDSNPDAADGAATFYVLGGKVMEGVGYRGPAKCGSDSDYDSSCDECHSVSSLSKVITFTTAPIKTGYCTKQGLTIKTWKKRYFILDEEGVSYFKTHFEKCPIRTIHKTDIMEARISIGIHLNRENLFEIVTTSRVFYVQAASEEDRDLWIAAINRMLARGRLKNKADGRKSSNLDLTPKRGRTSVHRHSAIM